MFFYYTHGTCYILVHNDESFVRWVQAWPRESSVLARILNLDDLLETNWAGFKKLVEKHKSECAAEFPGLKAMIVGPITDLLIRPYDESAMMRVVESFAPKQKKSLYEVLYEEGVLKRPSRRGKKHICEHIC